MNLFDFNDDDLIENGNREDYSVFFLELFRRTWLSFMSKIQVANSSVTALDMIMAKFAS